MVTPGPEAGSQPNQPPAPGQSSPSSRRSCRQHHDEDEREGYASKDARTLVVVAGRRAVAGMSKIGRVLHVNVRVDRPWKERSVRSRPWTNLGLLPLG